MDSVRPKIATAIAINTSPRNLICPTTIENRFMAIPFLLTNHVCCRGAVSHGCPVRDSRIMRLCLCAFHALRFSAAYHWIVLFPLSKHARQPRNPCLPSGFLPAKESESNGCLQLLSHTNI